MVTERQQRVSDCFILTVDSQIGVIGEKTYLFEAFLGVPTEFLLGTWAL